MKPSATARLFLPAALSAVLLGCATGEKWIEPRPVAGLFTKSLSWAAEEQQPFSPTTVGLAEHVGLDPANADERNRLLVLLEEEAHTQRAAELEFALAELAGHEAERLAPRDPDAAIGFYAESLIHGYRALSVDPDRRVGGTTARYNRSLEALLRLMRDRDAVRPDARITLPTSHEACSVAVELCSDRWRKEDFQQFEFADDYQVMGLRNHYYTSGVGVPLIGVRLHEDRDHPEDKYYPSKLCYPLTAVFRVRRKAAGPTPPGAVPSTMPTPAGVQLVLELHDPMDHCDLNVGDHTLPLETDLTTPLAYYLDQPELQEEKISTLGLLQPGRVEQLQGLYLLEPFDPDRIPVVMVHGLWSSPATWMEMFNDLRSDPRVHSRYQFWFYLYPTGEPFLTSAADLRNDLRDVRAMFDPGGDNPALDQTVLVGHSMGGLLSRLQTVDSGDDFWRVVTERDFRELDADPEVARTLSDTFYFRPDPSVRRVVTIGTPHRGSRFANGVTQWIGAKLISLPMREMTKRRELFRRNPDFFRPQIAARVMTSIDSLSPSSPMLATLLAAPAAPWINYHNIVGDKPREGWTGRLHTRGDGVVSVASARLDDLPRLSSQIVVPEGHVAIHRHPQSIEEVRRVLLKQLEEYGPVRVAASDVYTVRPSAN